MGLPDKGCPGADLGSEDKSQGGVLMRSNNIDRRQVWLLNKSDCFERESTHLGEKEGLEPILENGSGRTDFGLM